MAQFEPGKVLKTNFGAQIKIIKNIGEGGQGYVYLVEYGGKKKALKWYKPSSLRNPDAFYDNLKRNADKGSPDKAFLWPEAVTERTEGSFGYLMDLRPEGYYELSKILGSKKYNLGSFKAATEVCIRIVSAFRILHNNGYSYQDLNDGNFFINPKNGDVLICDNDNVAPDGTTTGILGKAGYMAPEIVVGKGKVLPNKQSDRYSLAAILFLILFTNNPLEGKRWVDSTVLTDKIQDKLYGSDPLFIFDPNNSSNRPDRKLQGWVIDIWNCMPKYLKDEFVKAFSQEALKDPNRRLRELDWVKVLTRFRSDIVRCSCGNEVFVQNATTTKCDNCGKPVVIKHSIKLPQYTVTAVKGSRIYRCQLGMCNADDALTPVGLIVSKPDNPSVLGYKNMLPDIIQATTPSGKVNQVPAKGVVPFKSGIIIEAFDKKIELN
ncbi:serine/threonine-protein kinase [Ruminococcus sp. zg-924]|uniref:serine/threonine protein kinase n=1 Tax=Ruminococcus sp. zg-924 TaxID=2678505 RepID=UPI00210A3C43|nr:serine/threonine-protein kinase [Ruminococcus sp. zg-924]